MPSKNAEFCNELAEALIRLCHTTRDSDIQQLALSSALLHIGAENGLNPCCSIAALVKFISMVHNISVEDLMMRVQSDLAKTEKKMEPIRA